MFLKSNGTYEGAVDFYKIGWVRLTGKREVGQMTPFDFVLLLLIANAVQNAMVGPDASLGGGIIAAATLLAINAIIVKFLKKLCESMVLIVFRMLSLQCLK